MWWGFFSVVLLISLELQLPQAEITSCITKPKSLTFLDSSSFSLLPNTKIFPCWDTEETCQWVDLSWLIPLLQIITVEKQCSILGPCSYQSVSLSQSLLLWRGSAEIQISLPLVPWTPSLYHCTLKSPPSSGATRTMAVSHAQQTTPQNNLLSSRASAAWEEWLLSSLSFRQAFLRSRAQHGDPCWDKQKLCVIINYKGMAHTGVHEQDTPHQEWKS